MKKIEIVESRKTPPAGRRALPPKQEEALRIPEHAGMLIVKGWILFETEAED